MGLTFVQLLKVWRELSKLYSQRWRSNIRNYCILSWNGCLLVIAGSTSD